MAQRSEREGRLATAEEWCRSADPLTRIQGLEVAAGLGPDGRERLFEALSDPDRLVRETAVRLAARTLSTARLLSGLSSQENAALRTACISALKLQGPRAVPAIRQKLESRDLDAVMFCLQVLEAMPPEDAVPLLIPFLEHPNANLAQAAVDALGGLKSAKAVPSLISLLGGDVWLALAAVLALGNIGDARATMDLVRLVDDDFLCTAALEALGKIADPTAVAPLCERFVTEERPVERDALLQALGSCLATGGGRAGARLAPRTTAFLEGADLEGYLREALRSDEAELRAAAGSVVRAFAIRSLYRDLVGHLDREPYDGPTVPFFVALPEEDGAEETLRAAATHERPGVRSAAMRILGARTEPWGAALVFERLDDDEPRIVGDAIRALARRWPPGAFERLLPFLHHADETISSRALEALSAAALEEDLARLVTLVETTPPGAELLDYIELSRRLSGVRFVSTWLGRLENAPPDLLKALLRALGSVRDPRVVEPLRRFLDHPAAQVRVLAIEALGRPEYASVGPELHRRLLVDRECTYHLARTLGRLRHQPAAEDLIGLYAGSSALDQVAILEALGAMQTPMAERFLKTELESMDRERQRAAATALSRNFREGNLALFARLARSQDWALRNTAAWALGEIGGEESREVLRSLVADPQEVVARTARAALERRR
jgi:HEAT repeat protein